MDEKFLYTHILNLTAPWQVKFLTFVKMQVLLLPESHIILN